MLCAKTQLFIGAIRKLHVRRESAIPNISGPSLSWYNAQETVHCTGPYRTISTRLYVARFDTSHIVPIERVATLGIDLYISRQIVENVAMNALRLRQK